MISFLLCVTRPTLLSYFSLLSLAVGVGDTVAEGQEVCVVEAMIYKRVSTDHQAMIRSRSKVD